MKIKDFAKEVSEAYAEDIRVGSAPDPYETLSPRAQESYTSGFVTQVGPSTIYEDSLALQYPERRDAGEWVPGEKRTKGDMVIWKDERWICDSDFHWDPDEAYVPPTKSTHWAKIEPRPTVKPRKPKDREQFCLNEHEKRDLMSPACKECTRRVPNCSCMVAEHNYETNVNSEQYLTSDTCGSFTTDELLTCPVCRWYGKRLWIQDGDKNKSHWSAHCFRTGIYMGGDPETRSSPILNKCQCPYYGWTVKEFYRETPPKAYRDKPRRARG